MKKVIYGAAAILLPTICGVLVAGIVSEKNGFIESFQAYGFICIPIAAITYFAGLRANKNKVNN